MKWGESFALPPFDGHPNVGVARPFAGVSNGRVLLAGGANFPIKPHLLLFGALGMVACLIVAPLVSVMTRRSTP